MENLNNKPNLAKAIISVMKSVKGIDKTMTVGSGSNAYKGVSDQEVKKVIGDAMASAGLCLLPIDVDAKVQVERWSEVDTYSKETPKAMKSKQSVFTEAKTKYLLLHESGESIELSGYGQGVDAQDKGAGKATTYALKYTMLYTFLIPTGKIDDADNFHSDYIDTRNDFSDMPDESERKILVNMVFNSTLDEAARIATLEKIANCQNYKQYELYKNKLENVQKGFDDVTNPSQADINKKMRQINGKSPVTA